jgi:hypothetical protein
MIAALNRARYADLRISGCGVASVVPERDFLEARNEERLIRRKGQRA